MVNILAVGAAASAVSLHPAANETNQGIVLKAQYLVLFKKSRSKYICKLKKKYFLCLNLFFVFVFSLKLFFSDSCINFFGIAKLAILLIVEYHKKYLRQKTMRGMLLSQVISLFCSIDLTFIFYKMETYNVFSEHYPSCKSNRINQHYTVDLNGNITSFVYLIWIRLGLTYDCDCKWENSNVWQ